MQKFKIELMGIFTRKDLPEEYDSFVDYKANRDNKEIKETDKIAVVKVADTSCFHVLFIDLYDNLEQIDKELEEELDGKIYNYNVRKILEGHINDNK